MRRRLSTSHPTTTRIATTHLVLHGYFSLEYSLRVLVRLPRVHGYRLAESHGVPELPRKDVLLHVPRRVVVVIVEADLAPPDVARVGHGLETASSGSERAHRGLASEDGKLHVHVLLHDVCVELRLMSVPSYDSQTIRTRRRRSMLTGVHLGRIIVTITSLRADTHP